MVIEIHCHIVRMGNADTETKAFYFVHVSNVFLHTLKYQRASLKIRRIDLFQFAGIISSAGPFQLAIVDFVSDSEILESAEQIPVNGLSEKHLGSGSSVKVFQNILSVHAVRSRCQSQQDLGMIVGKKLLLGICGGVVELIHADIIVVIRCRPLGQFCRIKGLDTDKKMLNVCRLSAIHIEFTKVEIVQNLLECLDALFQNLFSVSNEQETSPGIRFFEPLVVKSGDHGFSDARKCQGTDE